MLKNGKGAWDFWFIKIDNDGNKIWDKTLGGSGEDWINDILPLPDGGFLLAGVSGSGVSGDKTQPARGGFDYWIVKINANGQKIWDKTFGGTDRDDLMIIKPTDDEGFMLFGWSSSGANGDKTIPSRGGDDEWIIKIDKDGNKQWDKVYGGSGADYPTSVVKVSDGYIVGGYSGSNISGEKTANSFGNSDYWVFKIDASGNKIWDKTYGGNQKEQMEGLLESPTSGNFLLIGWSESGISGTKTQAKIGNGDYWIVEIDADGNQVGDLTIGGTGDDRIYTAVLAGNQNQDVLLLGFSNSNISGDKSEASKGRDDYWLVYLQSTPMACTSQFNSFEYISTLESAADQTIEVSVCKPVDQDRSITINIADGAIPATYGQDYITIPDGSTGKIDLPLNANESKATFIIRNLRDCEQEPNEQIYFQLEPIAGETLGQPNEILYEITDDPNIKSLRFLVLTRRHSTCLDCLDGAIAAQATGGIPPYTFSANGNPFTANVLKGIGKGIYTVEVKDSTGCTHTRQIEVK